jgi:hypothetical protein
MATKSNFVARSETYSKSARIARIPQLLDWNGDFLVSF